MTPYRFQGTLHTMLFQPNLKTKQMLVPRLAQCISTVTTLCLTALISCLAAPAAYAQEDDLNSRLRRVQIMMRSNELVAARPDMIWLKGRLGEDMQARPDFYIALSYVFEFYETDSADLLATASDKFRSFTRAYPDHEYRLLANYNLGDIEATLGNYEEALEYYIPIYNEPSSVRMQIDRKEVLYKIQMIYVATQNWEAGMPFFELGMRTLDNEVDRTTAAAYMMIGKAKSGDVSNMRQVLEFFDTPSPVFYSPRFNTALMEVGDQLLEEKDFATASLFYQFAKDYEELREGLETYIRALDDRIYSSRTTPSCATNTTKRRLSVKLPTAT